MLSEHFRLSKEFVIFDVPYKYSLPIMRLSRVNRLNGVSKQEEMLKDGKFYSRTELIKIVNEAADIAEANFEVIEVMNNYAVLPYS